MQVALHHSATHLQIDLHDSWFFGVTGLFPGVPIFFFISGFLISKSYERSPNLVDYVPNRILRIYPGLFVCFWVSLGSVFLAGYFESVEVSALDFLRWIAAQLTIGQFFNPEFMRLYGAGVLNGSLWTIPVELQFYIVVPVLYLVARNRFPSSGLSNSLLGALVLAFLVVNQIFVWGGAIYCAWSDWGKERHAGRSYIVT